MGSEALLAEASRRTPRHDPIPQIIQATLPAKISGYPVYDRALLTPENWKEKDAITLLGDAAHPMSPFKGQGANQALLDALLLARMITKGCAATSWRENGLRTTVLNDFEAAMFTRSAEKVKGSAQAAQLLHSAFVLEECDQPKGSAVKSKKTSVELKTKTNRGETAIQFGMPRIIIWGFMFVDCATVRPTLN
ncbi:FAD-dependent monooxygenase [Myroides odoratus]|uniref:FAD-dependent monooxygenase n=1 Tax=Myroides odoratus TaxID=256 RepID=UPI00286DC196|nr:FAD-dependent monooxygenase [Myroides odoratus]MCS4237973.1 2-polyprenyl-6-methoxyphenol hydroxylase-like FAD-dependent oxidoreductase [Myroides odoratus]